MAGDTGPSEPQGEVARQKTDGHRQDGWWLTDEQSHEQFHGFATLVNGGDPADFFADSWGASSVHGDLWTQIQWVGRPARGALLLRRSQGLGPVAGLGLALPWSWPLIH